MEEGNLQGIMALQGQPWSAEEGLEVCVGCVCGWGGGSSPTVGRSRGIQ